MEEGGAKRSFEDLDDDDEDIFTSSKKPKVEETVPGGATGMILSLRESLKKSEEELAICKNDLETAKVEVQNWHSVFQLNSDITSGATPEPVSVNSYLQNLKSSEESLREQLEKAKKKEAAFIVSLAKRDQEIAELKSTVRDLKAQLKPPSVQARRLLLDPAIHEEFTRLKNLVEEKDKKVKELEENIAAMNFTPQSKMGKMLMAKCRTLQEENEEVGQLHSEGKIHELSITLALQKSQNAALKSELEALCRNMDELTNNVEKSNELVFILQQKLAEKDSDLSKTRQDISHTPSEGEEHDVVNEIKIEETVITSDVAIEVVDEINDEEL